MEINWSEAKQDMSPVRADGATSQIRTRGKTESRRTNSKVFEKLKKKVRKLTNFWDSKQKSMPHLFKQQVIDELGTFELIDLSFKGRDGVGLEEGGVLSMVSELYEFSDISAQYAFDFEAN